MCPACFSSAAVIVAGVTSAGGLTAWLVKILGRKSLRERLQPFRRGSQD